MDHAAKLEHSQEVCWICESPEQSLQDLTAEQKEMLATLTRLQDNQDGQMTRRFCRDCIDRLTESFRFIQLCIEAENRLQICIDQQLIKLEGDDDEGVTEKEDEQEHLEEFVEDSGEQDQQFPCGQCNRRFSTLSRLQEHERMHQGIKRYACEHCAMSFTTSTSLKRHIQNIHLNLKRFVCEQCGHAFADAFKLKAHERTHISEKNFPCEQCSRRFKTADQLGRHRDVQHGPTKASPEKHKFECNLCQQTVSSASALHAHKLRHSEPGFMCSVCGKRFTTKLSLKLHMRSHSDERPFECDICHGRFKAEKTLHEHKMIHTKEKPHQCDVCERRFRTYSQMKNHRFLHTGLRPFVCQICGKDFNRPWNLRLHTKTHEGRSKDEGGEEVKATM